tara:strand:- start:13 stop:192 length:180 start_codon:yes stop_codon:yes gene_type:complete
VNNMVTRYQVLPEELKHCQSVDPYWNTAMIDRPIPGRLIYTDGNGRIFQLMPDGTVEDL